MDNESDQINRVPIRPLEMPSVSSVIMDEAQERGWTEEHLAKILGWPRWLFTEISRGTYRLTPASATDLANAFGTTTDFWLSLDERYRAWAGFDQRPGTSLKVTVALKGGNVEVVVPLHRDQLEEIQAMIEQEKYPKQEWKIP